VGSRDAIMVCSIIDFRCVIVNELIGDVILVVLIFAIVFFAFASRKKLGLKTTLWTATVVFPIVCYYLIGTNLGFAIATFIVGVALALLHARIVGNK
jgi:hypothetical protein